MMDTLVGKSVRIKSDVRPYGGRTFEVAEHGVYRNGREYVVLDMTSGRTRFGLLGKTPSPRIYYIEEIEPAQRS